MQISATPSRQVSLHIALLPVFVLGVTIVLGYVLARSVSSALVTAIVVEAPAEAVGEPAPVAVAAAPASPLIAPVFSPTVQYWAEDIVRWAAEKQLDPNLVATVMQIESCGNPEAQSGAGAQGLFQVMPFHFAAGEAMRDPDTNAARGTDYLAAGLATANGNVGLALAGYNGGHSVIAKPSSAWHAETQRYYYWGSGIYNDIQTYGDHSPVLDEWLAAGGSSLCAQAAQQLAPQLALAPSP